mgnify:CR=1 FL=1
MELGQRLKAARLEMGLSQRQLCGDVITRNMLSQIENGRVEPSLKIQTKVLTQIIDTPEYTEKLRYLAQIGANANCLLLSS